MYWGYDMYFIGATIIPYTTYFSIRNGISNLLEMLLPWSATFFHAGTS